MPEIPIPRDVWIRELDADGRFNPLCTATTKRGRRCRHRISGGQLYTWGWNGEPVWNSDADRDLYDAGTCSTHREHA